MTNFVQNINQNRIGKHIMYWGVFVLFWGFIWGLSDFDFLRNILIQLSCLPSRMLLVYTCLYFLLPKFFPQKKYVEFGIAYCLLVLVISVFIQRPFMMFYIQPHYLPGFSTNNFFGSSEIVNTALDINIAAIVPLGYRFIKIFDNLKEDNSLLEKENVTLKFSKGIQTIELKIDKTVHKIQLKDIEYVESQRNNVKIKLQNSELFVRQNISSLQEILPDDTFIRIHRSFIVNKDGVSSFSPSKIELSDTTVPIGRKYKSDVLEHFGYHRNMEISI